MIQIVHKTIARRDPDSSLWMVGDTATHYLVQIKRGTYTATYVHAVPKTDYMQEGDDLI